MIDHSTSETQCAECDEIFEYQNRHPVPDLCPECDIRLSMIEQCRQFAHARQIEAVDPRDYNFFHPDLTEHLRSEAETPDGQIWAFHAEGTTRVATIGSTGHAQVIEVQLEQDVIDRF